MMKFPCLLQLLLLMLMLFLTENELQCLLRRPPEAANRKDIAYMDLYVEMVVYLVNMDVVVDVYLNACV